MKNPITGNTIAWTFEDGPMARKRFEHSFATDGTVQYKIADGGATTTEHGYQVAQITDDVFAVTYLGSSGWTLTSILSFKTGTIVAIASNDEQLVVQHGTFQVLGRRAA